jgi:hypothetical protein
VELVGDVPVRIPAGGSAQVQWHQPSPAGLRAGKRANPPAVGRAGFKDIQLQLNQPPEGVSLGEVSVGPAGFSVQLKADRDLAQAGFADNLIIEAFRETVVRQKDGTPTNQKRRSSMGLLPAVPIQIVP